VSAAESLEPPGCIVCVLAAAEAVPPVPPAFSMIYPHKKLENALVRMGLHTGVTVATKYLFVYGVDAVKRTLCAEHRTELEKPHHGGGHG
jgi:hypothetical protein